METSEAYYEAWQMAGKYDWKEAKTVPVSRFYLDFDPKEPLGPSLWTLIFKSDWKEAKTVPVSKFDLDFDPKDPLRPSHWTLIFKSVRKK